jgi:hypothetical protein
LIIFIFIAIFSTLMFWTYNLIKSKKLISIIISYICVSILLISLFVGLYSFSEDIYYNGQSMESNKYTTFNYYYFSAQTFYSMSYSDFIPMKSSRLYSIIELFLSYLLHVIILGWIFIELSKTNKEK